MVAGEQNMSAMGHRVVLPSSFPGSPRYFEQLYQDSRAIERHYRQLSLFITFTANPNWLEVQDLLWEDSYELAAADRPNLVNRIYQCKMEAFLEDLRKHHIFGRWMGHCYRIEYKKRAMSHFHLLQFLHADDHFLNPATIDKIICAKFPSHKADPELHSIITAAMVHGPCGDENPNYPCRSCLEGETIKCNKGFPKAFCQETTMQANGFPLYRKRKDVSDGPTIQLPSNCNIEVTLDNNWVVPYHRYLSNKYQAHINVEVCGGVQAMKYIHGYVYKGEGSVTFHVAQNPDEISTYLTAWYIGSVQAAWGLFAFPIHQEKPTVYRLPVHLPNEHQVSWREGASIAEVQDAMRISVSKLIDFFRYNTHHPKELACLYQNFPQHHEFAEQERKWKLREGQFAIGITYHANPISGKQFYLWLLLTVVLSPKSYEGLGTLNGIVYDTFHGACITLGLLEDGWEWIECFNEAVVFACGSSLQRLFAKALAYEGISHLLEIWEQFRDHFCDDITPRWLEQLNCKYSTIHVVITH
jgi:hypothetical protein